MANGGNRNDDWDDGGDWGRTDGDDGFPNPAAQPGPQTSQQAPQPRVPAETWGQPREDEARGPMVHQPKPKLDNNDIAAIILSLFLPGIGQLMLGQTTKGIVLLAVTLFTCWGLGFLPILTAIDAYFVAMASKDRPLGDWEFFPDYKKYM